MNQASDTSHVGFMPWRVYRVIGGLITVYFGMELVSLIMTVIAREQAYALLLKVLTGQSAQIPVDTYALIAVLILALFVIAGGLFCRKEPKGRSLVWVAAVGLLPVSGAIYCLASTSPGVVNYSFWFGDFVLPGLLSAFLIWLLIATRHGEQKKTPSWLPVSIAAVVAVAIYYSPVAWYKAVDQEPLIFEAMGIGRWDIVEEILAEGGSANQQSRSGATALVNSLEAQHAGKITMLLLEHGADPNQTSVLNWPHRPLNFSGFQDPVNPSYAFTPLRLAMLCHYCSAKVALLMLEKGADPHAPEANELETDMLTLAVNMNVRGDEFHLQLVEELLKRGVEIPENIMMDSQLVYGAVYYDENSRVIELLVAYGADTSKALAWVEKKLESHERDGYPTEKLVAMKNLLNTPRL